MTELAKNQHDLATRDQQFYGKLPYSQYADKQAKADIETEIAGKQKMIALSQAELKALGGKRGLELAQKTVQSDRVKKQVEEIKNQQMMVAQHGKLGATIRQNAILARTALAGPLGVGAAAAAVGGAIAATVPSASPAHADMLAKSFELLSARIGTLLLPTVDMLALYLQKAANAVKRFEDRFPGAGDAIAGGIEGFIKGIFSGPFGIAHDLLSNAGGPGRPREEPTRTATMPAHFEAFDQAWRRIQQQAASTGPLEQELLAIQMANLPQQTRALNQIAANTTPANAPAPRPPLPQ